MSDPRVEPLDGPFGAEFHGFEPSAEPDDEAMVLWHEGALVAWDNLTVQHARADVLLHGPARTLRKTVAPPLWSWSVEYAV